MEQERQNITFTHLCELEPRLKELEQDIRRVVDDGKSESFCANRVWFRQGFKRRFVSLIGFERDPEGKEEAAWHEAEKKWAAANPEKCRQYPPDMHVYSMSDLAEIDALVHQKFSRPENEDPILTSSRAYDVGYRYLYNLLPPCRNCACM